MRRALGVLVVGASLSLVALVACSSSSPGSVFLDAGGESEGGDGAGSSSGGSSSGGFGDATADASGGDSGCSPNLLGRLRDFVNLADAAPASALDNDFENENSDDRGMVATDLGTDQKPVYANPTGMTATTHGQTQFDWWYRDTPGKNIAFDYPITLTTGDGGVSTFDDQEFFPLDGRGWNDEYIADDGKLHNFSFTFELHTTFQYAGGELFTFIGDDDVFVFVAGKLVVDLGGVHGAETKSVMLDTLTTDDAAKTPVALTLGTTYPLDIFYNERHTVSSHFRMDTSIVFNNCNPIIVPQ